MSFVRHWAEWILTVMTIPAKMIPRLNVCCVVRAAFSRVLRSPHLTCPSSLATVICFLEGPAVPVPPRVFWVA